MCSTRGCVLFVLTFALFFGTFIVVDILYLSRPSCSYIPKETYSIPSTLYSVLVNRDNSIIDKKSLTLTSNHHRAVECALPTALNQWSFEGVIDPRTGIREGPASIKTNAIEFDVWYSNDKPNGPGVLRFKSGMVDEEGLITNGTWQDGKLNCHKGKPCEMIMYLNNDGDRMAYVGPVKDNFLHGKGGHLTYTASHDNGTRLPFAFSELSYHHGNIVEYDNSTENLVLTIQFPHNFTKQFQIKKLSGLWNALMSRFSPTSSETCEVIYIVKGDPTNEERRWDCNINRVDEELMSEEHHIKGAFISLIQFELYWSSKAMTRIPHYPITITHDTSSIIQSRDEL
jgi:hypothetical protein